MSMFNDVFERDFPFSDTFYADKHLYLQAHTIRGEGQECMTQRANVCF